MIQRLMSFLLTGMTLLALTAPAQASIIMDMVEHDHAALWGDPDMSPDDRIENWKKQVKVLRDSRKKRIEYRLAPNAGALYSTRELWGITVEQQSTGWLKKERTVTLDFSFDDYKPYHITELRDSNGRRLEMTGPSRRWGPTNRGERGERLSVRLTWDYFLGLEDVDGRYAIQGIGAINDRVLEVPGEAIYAVIQVVKGTW